MSDPARYQVQFDVIRAVGADRPAVAVVDLAGWLEDQGADLDTSVRPDGLHWSDEAARWVGEAYLVPTLVSIAVGSGSSPSSSSSRGQQQRHHEHAGVMEVVVPSRPRRVGGGADREVVAMPPMHRAPP